MYYCPNGGTPMVEKSIGGRKLLACPLCGLMCLEHSDGTFRYIGTTDGNRQLRELLPLLEKEEEKLNETMALKTDPVT